MTKLIEINFQKLKSYFETIGFNESMHHENNYVFTFIKKKNDLIYLIIIRYFVEKKMFYMGGKISSWIISNKVNRILEKHIEIKKLLKITIEDTLLAYPNYNKNIEDESLNQLKNLPIQTQEEFEAALSIISTHIETYILPFFAKVPNLQTINDKIINKVPQQDYTKYIKGSTTFKVLIIMKLCNNSKFNDFKNWALEAYEEEIPNDPEDWTKALEDLKSLIIYLESGQYQECLT